MPGTAIWRDPGQIQPDAHVQLADMDVDGIDVQVIYPTRGISLSAAREVDLAVDIAHAYNDWLAEFCSTDPERLKGVALVALGDVGAAIKEARRAVEELGFIGVMMPTNVLDQDIGLRQFWPIYEEVERLNVGLAFHGGIRASQRMHGRFGRFIAVHTLAFPLECMVALTGYIYSGAPEQFPKLRIAALEASSVGPFPYGPDGRRVEIRGKIEAPLSRENRANLTSGQFYCAFELEETTCPTLRSESDRTSCFTPRTILTGTVWPTAVRTVTKRSDLTDSHKKRLLGENAQTGLRVQDWVFAGSRLRRVSGQAGKFFSGWSRPDSYSERTSRERIRLLCPQRRPLFGSRSHGADVDRLIESLTHRKPVH